MTTPSGMVAILTRGDGVVMATAADFDPKSPGYGRIEDAQRGRTRIALANALVRATCSDDVADTLRGYEAERLMEKLCVEKGYRVTIIAAGGEDS